MLFLSSISKTAELPVWCQNLIAFSFLGIVLVFLLVCLPWLERDSRKKFILRDFAIIMAMSEKEFTINNAVDLYYMSVFNLMDTWFKLTRLIDAHNEKLGVNKKQRNIFHLAVLLEKCYSEVAIVRHFEKFFVNRWLRKYRKTEKEGA